MYRYTFLAAASRVLAAVYAGCSKLEGPSGFSRQAGLKTKHLGTSKPEEGSGSGLLLAFPCRAACPHATRMCSHACYAFYVRAAIRANECDGRARTVDAGRAAYPRRSQAASSTSSTRRFPSARKACSMCSIRDAWVRSSSRSTWDFWHPIRRANSALRRPACRIVR